jgi:hypothetical protein
LLECYPGTIPLPSSRFFERRLQGTSVQVGINPQLMDLAADKFEDLRKRYPDIFVFASCNSDGTDFGTEAVNRTPDGRIYGSVWLNGCMEELNLLDDYGEEIEDVENELRLLESLGDEVKFIMRDIKRGKADWIEFPVCIQIVTVGFGLPDRDLLRQNK